MEGNDMSEKEFIPAEGNINNTGVSQPDIADRIAILHKALITVRESFIENENHLKNQIDKWQCICVWVVISAAVYLAILFHDYNKFNDINTGFAIYVVATRVLIGIAIFSLAKFCFKMVSSYIVLSEKVKHKIAVLKSLPALVESRNAEEQQAISNKLVDIVVSSNNADFLTEGNNISDPTDSFLKIIDSVKGLINIGK